MAFNPNIRLNKVLKVEDLGLTVSKTNYYDELNAQVQLGREGKNLGIPIGFPKFERYGALRKNMYYLIGGYSGSGKSSFAHDAFILNPVDYYIKNRGNMQQKLKIIFRSMERSKKFMFARWICRRIFLDYNIHIDPYRMLGWRPPILTDDQYDLLKLYKGYLSELEEIVEFIERPNNPVGVEIRLSDYFKAHGKIEEVNEYNKVYIPNDNNLVVVHIIDHVGLLRTTERYPNKKSAIDKWVSDAQFARDFYGACIIDIQQFNRDISNPIRLKQGDVKPNLEDFSATSDTTHAADMVVGLFDPGRYNVPSYTHHNMAKLQSQKDGSKMYRSLHILKSTYGADGVVIPLAFQPVYGIMKELPKSKEMTDTIYEDVISSKYFNENYVPPTVRGNNIIN